MVQIGALHVDFERREVRRHGEGLRLSARAFDILDVLFRANGAVVSKDALLEAVWPNQIVEENRLQVHVAALRKALHADRELIRTITGRGYRLAVPAGPANPPAPLLPASGELPAGAGPLIGRDGDLDDVLARLAQSSVVTLVGAGGIGKTALALRVAQCLRDADSRARSQPRVRHVVFVELASADSREAVLATLAVALDPSAEPGPHDPLPLLAGLGEGTLLVLDNAEQVVGVVAWLVGDAGGCRARPAHARDEPRAAVDPRRGRAPRRAARGAARRREPRHADRLRGGGAVRAACPCDRAGQRA